MIGVAAYYEWHRRFQGRMDLNAVFEPEIGRTVVFMMGEGKERIGHSAGGQEKESWMNSGIRKQYMLLTADRLFIIRC